MISSILHLLNPLWREYDGIFSPEHYMILPGIILMFPDPRLLKRLDPLQLLLLLPFDPLGRRQCQQKLSVIGEPTDHILLLLDLTPYVDDL